MIMNSTNDNLPTNRHSIKAGVMSRFLKSVDWMAVKIVVFGMYILTLIYCLFDDEWSFVSYFTVTTIVLFIFVGIPLGGIFLWEWRISKNGS
mgnify:CR=1 FL=1